MRIGADDFKNEKMLGFLPIFVVFMLIFACGQPLPPSQSHSASLAKKGAVAWHNDEILFDSRSQDGNFFYRYPGSSIDSIDVKTGDKAWSFDYQGYALRDQCKGPERVLLLLRARDSSQTEIAAIEAQTGQILWRHQTIAPDIRGLLCTDPSAVYYKTTSAIVKIEAETGSLHWSTERRYPAKTFPEANFELKFANQDLVLVAEGPAYLISLRARDGQFISSFGEVGRYTLGQHVIDRKKNLLTFASVDRKTLNTNVSRVDMASGKLLWKRDLGPSPELSRDLEERGGMIVVFGTKGSEASITNPDGSIETKTMPDSQHFVLSSDDGTLLKTLPYESRPYPSSSGLLITTTDPFEHQERNIPMRLEIFAENGRRLVASENLNTSTITVGESPAGDVYVLTERYLQRLDVKTGQELWKFSLMPGYRGLAFGHERAYVYTNSLTPVFGYKAVGISPDGQKTWQHTQLRPIIELVASAEMVLIHEIKSLQIAGTTYRVLGLIP